jgi:hypothetical protein
MRRTSREWVWRLASLHLQAMLHVAQKQVRFGQCHGVIGGQEAVAG